MSRPKKLAVVVAGAAGLALVGVGATALAHEHARAFQMKARIAAHIDEALDAVRATPEQRAVIEAARDHVFATFKDPRRDHAADFEDALGLFEADRLDREALAQHRARRAAEARRVGDAIVQAFYDAHDALTAPQRQAVADYVRGLAPKGDRAEAWKGRFVRHLVTQRIEDALDEVHATPEQRARVTAAAERVLATFHEAHRGHGAGLERMLQLFTADRIDRAQLDALRAEHQAKMEKVVDAAVQAIAEVHDTLDAGQRRTLVGWVRAHHHGKHG